MELKKNNVEKICSFYVSDWHLVTMLLPYINREINEKANIITVLEKDIEENIVTLINKLNLKNREKILSLNWKKSNGIKYSEIKNIMKKGILEDKLNLIFINGNKSYMDITNKNIEKFLQETLLYLKECRKYYDYKKKQEPIIQAQKEFEKKKRAFLREVKMSKEQPTKKQLYYYDRLCKKYNIEKKELTSKLMARDEIDKILKEHDCREIYEQ